MILSRLSDAMIKWAACLSAASTATTGFIGFIDWSGLDGTFIMAAPVFGTLALVTFVQVIKPWPRPPRGWLGPWFGNPKPTGGKG